MNKFIVSLILLCSFVANSNCHFEKFKHSAKKNLKGYIYLKTYKFKVENGEKEFEHSYVFTKSRKYRFVLKENQDLTDVKITIYDSQRRQVTNNFNIDTKEYYSGIDFKVEKTGIYFISYSFENSKATCAVSVLGFKKW